MAKIIGIDLGTTNSCMAVMEGGKPQVIPNAEGGRLTSSVVDPIKALVGVTAKRQQIVNPRNTIYSIKRLMGRRFGDPELKKTLSELSYEVVEGKNGMAVVSVEGKQFTPQEISARILQKLKIDAEAFLGTEVNEAVITVPAYFDDSQRQATKEAGEIAGFKVRRIINEPTAASLAYGLDKKKNEQIAVFDLGGGTFDISILEIGDGVFEVKSTNGDTLLGGDDFDTTVVKWLLAEFKKDQGVDLASDRQALQRLRDAAEKAKVELSTSQETEINIPFVTADQSGPKHLSYKLTRAKLEQLVEDLVERTKEPCRQALKDAGMKTEDIDEAVLVGGMTRMPKIIEVARELFGRKPHQGVNPDEVVAVGAAIQAGVLGGEVKDVLLLDVTPLTLGIETLGGVATPLIKRNTTIPTSQSQTFSTAADSQTSVEVHVVQGEREMAADNKSLGRFILDGIPPSPRGVPQVEVSFDIDANGILNVSAKDKATNKEQKITIQAGTGLSKDEVEKMVQDAEVHAGEDKAKKDLAEAKNIADNVAYTAEKTLKDAQDKITEDQKSSIENKVKDLRELIKTGGQEDLKSKTDELSRELQQIGQAMYGAAEPPPGGPAPTGDSGQDENKTDRDKPPGEGGPVEEGEVVKE